MGFQGFQWVGARTAGAPRACAGAQQGLRLQVVGGPHDITCGGSRLSGCAVNTRPQQPATARRSTAQHSMRCTACTAQRSAHRRLAVLALGRAAPRLQAAVVVEAGQAADAAAVHLEGRRVGRRGQFRSVWLRLEGSGR